MQSGTAEGRVNGMSNSLISTQNVETILGYTSWGALSRVPTLRSRLPALRYTVRRVVFGRVSRYLWVECHATLGSRVTLPFP